MSILDSIRSSSKKSVPQVSNPDYQRLIDANPYRNQDYNSSPWQNFLSLLGFRTQADAWRENMSVQAAEYDAAVLQKMRDEDYNSPQNQVERMRAAGLNPDIDGGSSIDPGSAAPMPEDPSTPMQSTGSDSEPILQFVNGVLNVFSTAVGLTQSIQGVFRGHLDNVFQSIQNESAFKQFAEGVFPYLIPTTPEDASDGSSWRSNSLEMAKMFAGNLPKRMQSKFLREVEGFWNSAPGEAKAFADWKNRVQNRKGYFSESSTFYDESDSALRIITDELASMNEKIYKASQTKDLVKEENDTSYLNSLDAGLQAEAENSANRVSKENNDMVGIMRSSLKSMVDKLDKASNEKGVGGTLSRITMALLSMLQLYISSQGMPSVSRSTSISEGSKSNSHSDSFSIGF